MDTTTRYVRRHDDIWYVGTSRVQASGVIAMWQHGYAPEEIQASFPALSLREVYGTILYYLEHREELDASFRAQAAHFAALKAEAEARQPEFAAELRARVARFRAEQQAVSETVV